MKVFVEDLHPGQMREQLTIKALCAQAQIQSNTAINYRGLRLYLPTYLLLTDHRAELLLWNDCNNTILGSDKRYYLLLSKHYSSFFCKLEYMHDARLQMSTTAYAGVCLHTSGRSRLCFTACESLTSGLNLSMFPAVGWAGKWQALSKISAVFTGMMGISGTFPTAVKSSTIPALLNTPGSVLHPARVPIKQLRHLVFGNSPPRKGVINSWKTVFTVKAS